MKKMLKIFYKLYIFLNKIKLNKLKKKKKKIKKKKKKKKKNYF